MSKSSKPIPIALPNDLLDRIKIAAEKLDLSQSETMRLCMKLGLRSLESNGFDEMAAGAAVIRRLIPEELVVKALNALIEPQPLPNVLPLRKEVDFNKVADPPKEKAAEAAK